MNILYVTSEAVPFCKTGGLADVAGSLPQALAANGDRVSVILPLYERVKDKWGEQLHFEKWTFVRLAWRSVYCGLFSLERDGVTWYFVDNETYFRRSELYGYYDDGERFGFFSRAVTELLKSLPQKPDVVHCNDWQTALTPVYLNLYYRHLDKFNHIKTVFTIHNIAYQGKYGMDILEDADARALLPARPRDGHKGTFGHVLCVAGSEGMAGAAVLCARAALRAGAGLVTAACPFPVLTAMQSLAPCAMAKVISDGASLGADAADALMQLVKGKRALAIGPGLGREEGVWQAIEPLIRSDIPKVVDADALYLLARYGGGVGANTVLTPHPGEMARLCGAGTEEVLLAPVEYAQQLAAKQAACVLLKGATSVIAQREDVTMNVTGCDGMGTGGSGDVLTGVIAALMAQGMPPMDAARVGAFYHGRAGETAQAVLGARAVTAQAVLDRLRIE